MNRRQLIPEVNEINRRRFLRSALIAGAVSLGDPVRLSARSAESSLPAAVKHIWPGKNESPAHIAVQTEARRFAPVKVARNRIIREVVGLRPYRAEGFVVSAERLGSKLLIHNYGHGGAGVTLSWGTA